MCSTKIRDSKILLEALENTTAADLAPNKSEADKEKLDHALNKLRLVLAGIIVMEGP